MDSEFIQRLQQINLTSEEGEVIQFDLFTEEVRQDIRMGMGQVVEVDCKGFTSDQARFLQIRVEILLKPKVRPNTVTGVTPQTNLLTAKILGNHFENSENHGTAMVISTVHAEDKEVNTVSGFLKYKNCVYQPKGTAVKTKDKSKSLVIKESAEIVANPVDIVANPNFPSDNLFSVPILDTGPKQNSNFGEFATEEKTREEVSVQQVWQNSEDKSKATTWKRVVRKGDTVGTASEGTSSMTPRKRVYTAQKKTWEKGGE
nr:hypothetical protein CFP56_29125 [Quercus suber]